ncbi:MAG TPA: DUF2206 domain-containing protein [Candidatus Saccharimonas sp.]|nr:DUF2206 domain-containing protein [Candidatus Saccharimonas sp.]
MKITLKKLTIITVLWSALFGALAATHYSPFGLLNIVGFPYLLFVPGYFVVLLLNMHRLSGLLKLLFSLAFSLALLIFWPLIGNAVLPLLHVNRPLDTVVLIPEIGLLVVLLWIALAWRNKWRFKAKLDALTVKKPAGIDVAFALTPLIFVGLAIMGSTSLNNGGSNLFTVIMLVGMTVYIGALMYMANRLRQSTLFIAVFLLGLSLLFMTSLRGWYITGHDIQHEFRLFMQTTTNGRWSMGVAKDAYNACLSVTLLPTVFYRLLDVQTYYVFKVLFQIIFAFVPCLVLLTGQSFLKGAAKRTALLATLYFVSFPTFFTDMPMLNRQELALLFAGIMVWLIFNRSLSLWTRRIAFLAMVACVIVSHYSTNYTMLGLIAVCVVAQPTLRFIANHVKPTRKWYRALNLKVWREKTKQSLITLPMLIILFAASFVWSVQLTNSSGQLTKVFFDTMTHIQQAIAGDSPSQDTYFSYDTVNKLTDQQKLYRYFEQLGAYSHQRNGDTAFYDKSTYSQYKFSIEGTPEIPLTPLGTWLKDHGVPVAAINDALHANVERFLQLMVVAGVCIILFAKRFNNKLTSELRSLHIGAVLLMGGMIALPVLLADYDLSRMLQQLLLFAGIAVVLGSMYVIPKIKERLRISIACAAVLIMFTTMTGVFTAFLGGYQPQLHLFNSGIYYDLYYTHKQETLGADWLNGVLHKARTEELQTDSVFVDRYTSFKVQEAVQQDLLNDVYPGLVRKNAYVFLGYATVSKQQATVYYNGKLISYSYPIQFLDDNKNLIYNNGGSRVYH